MNKELRHKLSDDIYSEMSVDNHVVYLKFYNKNGDLLPYVKYDSPVNTMCSRYTMILNDLKLARRFLKRHMDTIDCEFDPDHIIHQSLWFSFLITYGKCFTDASGGRKIKLEASTKGILKGATDIQIKLHEELMGLRHNYIAHSGKNDAEYAQFYLILNHDLSNLKILDSTTISSGQMGWSDHRLPDVESLVELILLNLRAKLIEIQIHLNREIARMPIEELYKRV